ncbi:class I SAM-dependent methyltransferase [Streptomyces xanthophaeus]|uniref:class I SAM-dependent methyltransferase n=1 Tax=Streptomyces xanthophaeus TaxID=67385 RepID=UPI00398FB299
MSDTATITTREPTETPAAMPGAAARGTVRPGGKDLYCVVGPELFVAAEHLQGRESVDFRVLEDQEQCLGVLHAARSAGVVALVPDEALLSRPVAAVAEAVRLAVRTLAKTFRDGLREWMLDVPGPLDEGLLPLLAEEGFELAPESGLRSVCRDFTRGDRERAASMEEVYADPYTVPWNFVPLETDVLERLLAGTPPGSRVLDLGCGYGKNARQLIPLGYRVAGSDISASAVARARRLLGPGVELSVADATALPWPDASFDAALDIGCLHCMPAEDRPAAVRELARVLTPEGVLYSRMFRPRPAQWLAAQPFHTTDFGLEAGAAAALLGSVFTEVEIESTPHATYLVARGPVNR